MGFRLIAREKAFFPLFVASGDLLVEATRTLTELLAAAPSERRGIAERLSELEHAADETTHEIVNTVNSSSTTPFERSDLHTLAVTLDDCMDHLEAATDLISLYRFAELPSGFTELFGLLSRMAEVTAEAMPRLASLQGLSDYWVEVNRLENRADAVHRRMLAELFETSVDPIHVIKLKDVLDTFEDAADSFEEVAHIVEGIAVKRGPAAGR